MQIEKHISTVRPYPGWLGIPLLSLSYALMGRVAILLAIPPGYATAIFPPAGIAVAALLLWGNRLWPGVFFGSLLLNSWISLEQSALTLTGMGVAVGVGLGASLQVLFGAWAIRRTIGFPMSLDNERDILLFMLLAGPTSCLINSNIGALSLLNAGFIPGSEYAYSWFTWWVGDSIGVMIAAPLMFITFAKPRRLWWHRRFSVAAPMLALLVALMILFVRVSNWELDRNQTDFKETARNAADRLKISLTTYINSIESIERFIASAPIINRSSFRTFVEKTIDQPGIHGVSWNPIIKQSQRANYEERMQTEGFSGFRITERDHERQLTPAAIRDDYVVVTFIEPLAGNEAALGFDIASSPNRLKALHQAIESGRPVATERITLVQETGSQAGFLVCVPVYNGPSDTVLERQANIHGFAVGVFRVGEIVDEVLYNREYQPIEINIFDDTDSAHSLLYGQGEEVDAAATSPYNYVKHLAIGDRTWTLSISPSSHYLSSSRGWQAWGILVAGLLFISMLSVLLLAMTGRSYQIEKAIEERTRELQYSNNELEAYSYSLAHDLRTPLRSIGSFSQILIEEAGAKLNSDETGYLNRIVQSAIHMSHLIDDILELSRVSRLQLQMDTVNLSEICRNICHNLSDDDPDRSIEWKIQGGLVATGDRHLLTIALGNLLNNAWKFSRDNHEVHIEFGLTQQRGQDVFFVRDNGIGFEMGYAERIFGVFQRLHRGEDFEGTGVGLATVQRIVERHQGWVRAESSPLNGATIYFHIPAVEGASTSTRHAARQRSPI